MSDSYAEFISDGRKQIRRTRDEFDRKGEWVITRRLHSPSDTFGVILSERCNGYIEELPAFNGLNFEEVIGNVVKEKGSASYLDIGGGAGLVALDLRRIFPADKLKIVVMGNKQDTQVDLYDPPRGIFRGPTENDLEEAQVDFVHSNFIDSHKSIKLGQFDVLTSVFCFDYIKYSHYTLFKKAWRMLKEGGIGFISKFDVFLMQFEGNKGLQSSAFDYLRKEFGMEVFRSRGGVSFRRSGELPNIFVPADSFGIRSVRLRSDLKQNE